jgi:hypothetical protein
VSTVRRFLLLAALCLATTPAPAQAQMFFSTRPDAPFAIGPLTVRATVTPALGSVEMSVLWALDIPGTARPADLEQDIFLLWPGAVESPPDAKPADKTLATYVEQRGFASIGEGRLPLYALNIYAQGAAAAPQPVGEVLFVTFVQDSDALGLSPPATWIRIPWLPQMADRIFMMELRMRVAGVIKPKKVGWVESLFVGDRHLFQLSFHEVRDRPLFPMYAEHRDRALRLADAPAELVAHFSQSDGLRIEQLYPPTSIRRLSENLESTEVVSLFMGATEGVVPQHLSAQFGYYSRLQGLILVAIPLLLLAAGPALGPVMGRMAAKLGSRLAARVHWAPRGAVRPRQQGVLLSRETLDHIVPGTTTIEQVRALLGPEAEEQERLDDPDHRTLIYRGWRAEPLIRRRLGWFSTVERWEIFAHEVRIEVERGVVKGVHAEVRRRHSLTPDLPA